MIQSRIINNSLTEIYSDNYITQAYPTNFHSFFKRKILLTSENINDYKEVTESEKTNIENSDAKWIEPPQNFIDQWNTASTIINSITNNKTQYGIYNSQTGYFELNGVLDITYQEAIIIMLRYRYMYLTAAQLPHGCQKLKALLPIVNLLNNNIDIGEIFQNLIVKQLVIKSDIGDRPFDISVGYRAFRNCKQLEIIHGGFALHSNYNVSEMFKGCIALKEVRIYGLTSNFSFIDSSLISYDSLNYIVQYASNTSPITITVHPDIYSKISDETNEEWHQLIDLAANKNITFVTNG